MVPELVWEDSAWADETALGASRSRIDVLELGRSARGGRPRTARMGQFGDVMGGLFGLLSEGTNALADVVAIPLNVIADGASTVLDGISSLASNVPVVGEIVGTIMTIGKVLLNVGLHLPETILRVFSTVLGAFQKLATSKQGAILEQTAMKLIAWARARHMETEMRAALSQNGPAVGGRPAVDAVPSESENWLKVAAGVALPALGAGVVWALS